MKWLTIGGKLFKNKLTSNILIAIQLAIVAVVVIVVYNMYLSNTYCLNAIEKSDSRMIYCNNYFSSERDRKEFNKLAENIESKFSYVKGVSEIYQSGSFSTNKELFYGESVDWKGKAFDVFALDDETIRYVKHTVSSGKWLTTELIDGYVPCVVGGAYSNYFKVGQKLEGYTLGLEDGKEIKQNVIIVGVLAKPEKMLSLYYCGAKKASDLFDDMSGWNTFALVPSSLYKDGKSTGFDNALIYLDENCTDKEYQAVCDDLSTVEITADKELIEEEKQSISNTVNIMLPYILLLFIVIVTGVLSITVLTAIKNMDSFNIYYLLGCPKYKIVLMLSFYVLLYMVVASVFFTILMTCLKALTNFSRISLLQPYILVNSQSLLPVIPIVLAVLLLSLAVPIIMLNKKDLMTAVRNK